MSKPAPSAYAADVQGTREYRRAHVLGKLTVAAGILSRAKVAGNTDTAATAATWRNTCDLLRDILLEVDQP